jgi:hypothetical protein
VNDIGRMCLIASCVIKSGLLAGRVPYSFKDNRRINEENFYLSTGFETAQGALILLTSG